MPQSTDGQRATPGLLTDAAYFLFSPVGPPLTFGPPLYHLHSASSHHQGQPRVPLRWWVGATLLLLLMSSPGGQCLPRGHHKPRWVNPCDLPGHVFDPATDMEGAPSIHLRELFSSIKERARVAKEHAMHVKDNFLKLTFDDPDFVPGTSVHRQNWLPKIPTVKEDYFEGITKEEALRKSFEFLQFYAVGVEQLILDQVIYDGVFVNPFRDVENHLTQLLCELQLGLFTLRVPTSQDVMRDVMSQEYRDVSGRSRRNIRDYLILRDYVAATDFVAELFSFLERTL